MARNPPDPKNARNDTAATLADLEQLKEECLRNVHEIRDRVHQESKRALDDIRQELLQCLANCKEELATEVRALASRAMDQADGSGANPEELPQQACDGVDLWSKSRGDAGVEAFTSQASTSSGSTLLDPAACGKHMAMVRSLWQSKEGSIFDELIANLRQPHAENAELSEPLTQRTLAEVCAKLLRRHAMDVVNPEVQRNPLALAGWALYTMTDVDVDRLLGFECPALPEDPVERGDFYKEYRKKHEQQRNPLMFQVANWGARVTYDDLDEQGVAMNMTPQAVTGLHTVSTWVKWLCFLGASTQKLETPMQVTRVLCDIPDSLVLQLSEKRPGDVLYWAAPSSTTTDDDTSRAYCQTTLPVDKNVLFIITEVTEALPLFKLSRRAQEQEFLLPPFSMLEVTSVLDKRPERPLTIECAFRGCKMPADFRQECLDDLAVASARLEEELREMGIKLADLGLPEEDKIEALKSSVAELVDQHRELSEKQEREQKELSEQHKGLEAFTNRLAEDHHGLIDKVELQQEVCNKATKTVAVLRSLVSDIESFPTRRVDWVIQDASRRLMPPPARASEADGLVEAPYGSWSSPHFDAAGVRGLRVELRVYRFLHPPVAEQEKGDCALILSAPRGANIACSLSVGASSQVFEKRFDSDRDVLATHRLCFVKDHVDPATDSLRIGVELLESVFQLQRPAVHEADGRQLARRTVSEANEEGHLSSFFVIHRRFNNRVLQQVRAQVDHLKSCTLRRVEWRLEDAYRMSLVFPRGAEVRSQAFDACGLEGLQFVFCPSGHSGAADGYCSLFLSAPAGASVRGWLEAGPERRKLSQTWDRDGKCGRLNFCLFESVINPEDHSVLLALDIEEVQQDFAATLGLVPALGFRALGEDATPDPIKSVLKLHRGPVRALPEPQEAKALPPIAAARGNNLSLIGSGSLSSLRERRPGQADAAWRKQKQFG